MTCTKAIIPVAGFGTRRLPITKAIEKCMLPIGNRPIVDYVVEDCIKAGITEIIFVVSEQSDQLHRYYGKNQLLEEYLTQRGKTRELEQLAAIAPGVNFHYVVQTADMPYGTAIPVNLCSSFVESGEQVLVLMGDDFIYHKDGASEAAQLLRHIESAQTTAGLLAVHIPRQDVGRYGVIETRQANGHDFFVRVVEQPKPDEAPTNLINVSKYVFDAAMFDCVRQVCQAPPAANGEYQVTEALNLYVRAGKQLAVVQATGEYLDGGALAGWLHANNRVCES